MRTTFKLEQDTTGREDVVEDTIGAYTTMKYWAGEYVDLSTNTIALMSNFKPNAKLTQYSGTKVTEIQVVAENAGTLYIGTAKVADVVTARTSGSTYTASTKSYSVTTAGVNTITLDLTVAEDETIVFGGSGSTAKVYVVKNLPVSDEQGNFALINGSENTDVLAKTGNYADTLAVSVRAEVENEVALFKNLTTDYPATGSNLNPVTGGGYKFTDSSMFEGKTITKIGVAVDEVKSSSGENPYMTVYKVKTSVTKNFISNGIAIKVYFPTDTQTNTWAYANCNIELDDDEILVFGAQSGDTLVWNYVADSSLTGQFLSDGGSRCDGAKLIFDVYAQNGDWSEHIELLEEKEQNAITQVQEQALRGYL